MEIKYPCSECGSDNIEVKDYGYSSFNVGIVKCLDCNHRFEISPMFNIGELYVKWNDENNPRVLRERYTNEIKVLQDKIDKLPKYNNIGNGI